MTNTFIFPSDNSSTPKAGAVHPTSDGSDFYVPTREMGSESISGNVLSVTTAGTAVQFPNIPCRKVLIIARRANTGSIYIGGSTVTSSVYGAELLARDSLQLEVSNTNLLYINSSVNGEGVSYIAI
jgi:hypothetical protein